jgi:hypothetical protein
MYHNQAQHLKQTHVDAKGVSKHKYLFKSELVNVKGSLALQVCNILLVGLDLNKQQTVYQPSKRT